MRLHAGFVLHEALGIPQHNIRFSRNLRILHVCGLVVLGEHHMQMLTLFIDIVRIARKITVFNDQRTLAFQHQPETGKTGVVVNADAAVNDDVALCQLVGINRIGIRSHAEGHRFIRRGCGNETVCAERRCRQNG